MFILCKFPIQMDLLFTYAKSSNATLSKYSAAWNLNQYLLKLK